MKLSSMIGSKVRIVLVSAVAGAAAVAALAVGPAVARPAVAPPAPIVIGGHKNPVSFLTNGNPTTLATMTLPAGGWVIMAKAQVMAGSNVLLRCSLTAGGDSDQVNPVLINSYTYQLGVSLEVTHAFGSAGGKAILACNSSGVAGQAAYIRMIAIKAGTLTNVGL